MSQRHFLIQIEARIDWQPFQEALAGLYHPRSGRHGYPPLVLLKALPLQRWYNFSDPRLEEAIRDRLSFQRFLGLAIRDPVPETGLYSGSHTPLNHQKERISWIEADA